MLHYVLYFISNALWCLIIRVEPACRQAGYQCTIHSSTGAKSGYQPETCLPAGRSGCNRFGPDSYRDFLLLLSGVEGFEAKK